ncbi:MAG: DUF3306 domain-containing protein [Casimicrobiaceae bacterium]
MSVKQGSDTAAPGGFSLRRWSRRKLDAAREAQSGDSVAQPPNALPAQTPVTTAPPAGGAPTAAELPPVESLTLESDFTAFFQPQVDEGLKRAALKQLFRDPRFNVMDGLDIYVGDYTKSDPIPDHILKQLVQARAIFNPPKTMMTPDGYVVDVPPEAVPQPAAAEPVALGDQATAVPTVDTLGATATPDAPALPVAPDAHAATAPRSSEAAQPSSRGTQALAGVSDKS